MRADAGVGGGATHDRVVGCLQPAGDRQPAQKIGGGVDLIQPVGDDRPLHLDEAVALDGFAREIKSRGGVGRIKAGDEFGIVAHAAVGGVGQLGAVGGDGTEVIHLPGVGNAVVVHVEERVVAGEVQRAAGGQRVRLVVGGLIVGHVAELHDVLAGVQIAEGDEAVSYTHLTLPT